MNGFTDLHAHFVAPELFAHVTQHGAKHDVRLDTDEQQRTWLRLAGRTSNMPAPPPMRDAAARIAWMDANGIDRQLLSGWMDYSAYHLPGPAAQWFARAQNETLAETVRAYPMRFMAAAAVPLQDPARAVEELRHAAGRLGMRAVQIGATIEDVALDDRSLDPFWHAAEEHDVAVIVHPVDVSGPPEGRRYFLHICCGNPAATTAAAAALMLGGVLERHPRLRVLLVHGGGYVPYQFSRIERAFHTAPPAFRAAATKSPAKLIGRFYFDTMLHDDGALRLLRDFAGNERVVFGSDMPFPMGITDVAPQRAALEEVFGPAVAQVLDRNAERFLGMNR